MAKKILLGELLIQNRHITPQQLEQALAEQKKTGNKLGMTLVQLGFLSEETLLNFLAEQLHIPFIDLRHYSVSPQILHQIPEIYARRFRAIALEETPDGLLVGMVDPLDIYAEDELSHLLKRPLKFAIVREVDLLEVLDTGYRRLEENIASYAKALSEELQATDIDLAKMAEQTNVTDAPVVKLLQSIFEDAIKIKASDIHIEPEENVLRVRQRVDGQLQEHLIKDPRIAPALAQRLKLMAKLNITERRLPQDGRFSIKIDKKIVDVRLSTMPIQYGESVVMRLLIRSDVIASFEQLGMPAELIKLLHRLIELPYGMILMTGPTGSGKTTSLYSILNEINSDTKKIITIEDPVEYRLPRINQVQVNPYINLDFARVLRAGLRQDPDIIMVGEIRDKETADIALRAAITGHLVFATLHTNDAISSAIRLIDMGNEGYMVAAAVRALLSQRLVRRICLECIAPHTPTSEEEAWLKAIGSKIDIKKLKQGKGCDKCNQTGYKGRLGVFEYLVLSQEMIIALAQNNSTLFSKLAHEDPNFVSMQQVALNLVMEGVTTLKEAMDVALESEDVSRMIVGNNT